jgi:hypothetical protein
VKCIYCNSKHLRFSRLHSFDIPRLMFFQVPVRCYSCQERFYSNLISILKLRSTNRNDRKQRGPGKTKTNPAKSEL